MNIIYQSPDYDPAKITNRYLHISMETGKPIVTETIQTPRGNNTYRMYELPEEEYYRYGRAIDRAMLIKPKFPNAVDFVED